MKGIFVTFDGPNGAGKSTVISEVYERLLKSGYDIVITKEPTESELGSFIRKSEERYSSYTLACLVAADRYNHVEKYIVPLLNEGKIVLCDRFTCSSLVLQRMDGVSLDFIWNLNSRVAVPDIFFILTASSSILQHRLAQRAHLTRFERGNKSEIELHYYNEAFNLLTKNGLHAEIINTELEIGYNVELIVDYINRLLRDNII